MLCYKFPGISAGIFKKFPEISAKNSAQKDSREFPRIFERNKKGNSPWLCFRDCAVCNCATKISRLKYTCFEPQYYCVLASWCSRGVVALSVECRTCDQEVVGSSLGPACGAKSLGKFLTPMCLCSPSSTSWYRPKGGDALRLGVKAGVVRVWVTGKTV